MSTYTQLLYQLVFSTKHRKPALEKDNLIEYVKNQEEHHKTKTYREELIELLREHGVEFDEKYLA